MALTRARIGQPVIRGRAPRSPNAPCTDPGPTYDVNTLLDPGFEFENAQVGTSVGGFIADDLTATSANTYGWRQGNNNNAKKWVLSTTNPRSGTYHLRASFTNWPLDSPSYLQPLNWSWCDASSATRASAARVDTGDLVTWSFYLANGAAGDVRLQIRYWDATFASSTDTISDVAANTSGTYTLYSYASVAPYAGWAVAFITFPGAPDTGTYTYDLDDCSLVVT